MTGASTTSSRTRPGDGRLRQVRRGAGPARADDKAESVRTPDAGYAAQTAPLKDFYARRGLLRAVDGVGAPEAIEAAVAQALGRR